MPDANGKMWASTWVGRARGNAEFCRTHEKQNGEQEDEQEEKSGRRKKSARQGQRPRIPTSCQVSMHAW